MNAKELGDMPAYPIESDDAMNAGMTIRQRFAMAAMQGYLSSGSRSNCETVALMSFEYANAMLAESIKESP